MAVETRRCCLGDDYPVGRKTRGHTFKQIAERHGISERVSDEITGHAPLTVGRGYGRPTLPDMATALKKFPRYSVDLKGTGEALQGPAEASEANASSGAEIT
jgi:hypothetical protein